MPEGEVQQQQTSEAVPMDTGISQETYNASKKEAEELRAQVAALKARVEVSDGQKREQLTAMKDTVVNFFEKEVYNNSQNEPYKQQLAPIGAYLKKIGEGDQIDTDLAIGRTLERIDAGLKREREEFSKTKDASLLLAESNKKLDEVTGERDAVRQRVTELEGLVEERTKAAQAFQDELAKHGAIKEKIDFSNKAARENTGTAAESNTVSVTSTSITASASGSAPIDPHAALFDFMQAGPKNGGLKIMQSSTAHGHLGATAPAEGAAIAAAMRGY